MNFFHRTFFSKTKERERVRVRVGFDSPKICTRGKKRWWKFNLFRFLTSIGNSSFYGSQCISRRRVFRVIGSGRIILLFSVRSLFQVSSVETVNFMGNHTCIKHVSPSGIFENATRVRRAGKSNSYSPVQPCGFCIFISNPGTMKLGTFQTASNFRRNFQFRWNPTEFHLGSIRKPLKGNEIWNCDSFQNLARS